MSTSATAMRTTGPGLAQGISAPLPFWRVRRSGPTASHRPNEGDPVKRKLVVFVPREALDPVRDALFAAGAGRIGDYQRCSWYTAGTGTFLGGEGTAPTVGERGREERVAELRLETVFPEERQDEVLAALRTAH